MMRFVLTILIAVAWIEPAHGQVINRQVRHGLEQEFDHLAVQMRHLKLEMRRARIQNSRRPRLKAARRCERLNASTARWGTVCAPPGKLIEVRHFFRKYAELEKQKRHIIDEHKNIPAHALRKVLQQERGIRYEKCMLFASYMQGSVAYCRR